MLCFDTKDSQSDGEKNIYKTVNYNNNKEMRMNGSESLNGAATLNMKKDDKAITIKVKSYADPVFVALRLLDNLTSEELSKTLNLTLNAESIKKARESLGASGSFFFFSFDHRLVIKTIN